MEQIDLLRKLFDEKIIDIINNFLDNNERKFSLTQISSLSKTNIATTLRILNKLMDHDIIELSLIGKSKFYKLKQSEKSLELNRLLKKEDHIQEFVTKLKNNLRVKKVILETKTQHSAKLLIVGDLLSKDKINNLVEEIKEKYKFRIQFIEINEKQFSDMKSLGLYNIDKKIIWERQ